MTNNPKKRGHFTDIATLTGGTPPNLKAPGKCPACGWEGTLEDAREIKINTDHPLSTRKGTHWHCPQCAELLWAYYSAVS